MNRIPPASDLPANPATPTDIPAPAPSEHSIPNASLARMEAAPLPRSLVNDCAETLLNSTLAHSGVIRDRMQALQIQPRPFSFEEPNVVVYSTDPKSHTCSDCTIATMMIAGAHSAALDLHNLACTVNPVPTLHNASERFGVAFFAQTRHSAGAAIRLRDTLDIVAAEMVSRSLAYIPERPWIEFVHQMLSPIEAPTAPHHLLPLEVIRIRFRGLEWSIVESLLANALRSLPLLTEHNQRSDVFTITLSGLS